MDPSFLRSGAFLAGLVGLREIEIRWPDHLPTAPLRRRWVANLGLGLINGAVVSLLCLACFELTARGIIPASFAPFRRFPASLWVLIPAEILVLDLFTYFLHRAYHVVPLLWRLHLVHHSDLDLDVSSASRFHSGEVVLSSVLKLGFVVLIGISPAGLVVFEVVMLACAQFQHANVRVPVRIESALWRTLVPPAMHRIHHTPPLRDTNSNFGTILTAWDALFGTLNRREPLAVAVFGIPELRQSERLGILSLAVLPFRRVAADERPGP